MKKKAAVRDQVQKTILFHLKKYCRGEARGRCWQEISGIVCDIPPPEQWWKLDKENEASHLHGPLRPQGPQEASVYLTLAEKLEVLIQIF